MIYRALAPTVGRSDACNGPCPAGTRPPGRHPPTRQRANADSDRCVSSETIRINPSLAISPPLTLTYHKCHACSWIAWSTCSAMQHNMAKV